MNGETSFSSWTSNSSKTFPSSSSSGISELMSKENSSSPRLTENSQFSV
jgi:hypothetical protein